MTSPPRGYLERLTADLAGALARMPREFLDRHRGYITAAQNDDGGWSGREGGSDLYYTAFALRSQAITGGVAESMAAQAAAFLSGQLSALVSVVDFMSLLYAARLIHAVGGPDVLSQHEAQWPARVATVLETFRKSDGGYSKSTDGTNSSTYHTFLVALCYELIGATIPNGPQIVEFLRSRRREDGGYVEVSPARRGGTNPTAAAIALLQMLGALDSETSASAVQFLTAMQSDDGGLRANGRVPLADLLSTFTGLLTLRDLSAMEQIDVAAARQFVRAIDSALGGFHAGIWDEARDVEYTFYGLGCVALLGLG
jgi:geranylgeranyl transferase type-2 subunit beta